MSTASKHDTTPGLELFMRDQGREGIDAGLATEELMEGAYAAGVKAARAQVKMPGFSVGETYERGDCGNWVAGIDHVSDGYYMWGHRIEVYGKNAEDAANLRDQVLRAISSTPAESLLDKSTKRGGHYYQGWNAYRKEQAKRLGIEE